MQDFKKKTFENKALHTIICLMCLFKIVCIFLVGTSIDFFYFSFPSLLNLFILIVFSDMLSWLAWLLFCILFLAAMTFFVFLIIFAVNRKGASIASIALIFYCFLDALATFPYLLLPLFLVGLFFNLLLVILLISIRRSRNEGLLI